MTATLEALVQTVEITLPDIQLQAEVVIAHSLEFYKEEVG